jgi:hypothetical protein
MSHRNSPRHINIRSAGFAVAWTDAPCRQCAKSTRVLAVVLPPQHEALVLDDENSAGDTWESPGCAAWLFHIESLPPPVVLRLQFLSPGFRRARSAPTQGACWVNHCANCGSLLEDHDLHCEPGGAFLPSDPQSGARIRLEVLPERLEAAAAGYSIEPHFMASMSAG